jgi:hypothetical protein
LSPAGSANKGGDPGFSAIPGRIDSGLIFVLDPGRITPPDAGGLAWRRAGTLLRGLTCRRLQGSLAVKGDRLALEVTTQLDREPQAPRPPAQAPTVQPGWLERVPSAGAMAVVSVALEPSAESWSFIFDVADQVERADPARTKLAPLRERLTLLAAVAGVSLEADLLPHLRGLTASPMSDGHQPGVPTGLLLVLHTDAEPAAARLTSLVLPRLSTLITGKKQVDDRPEGAAGPSDARKLGTAGGRGLTVWTQGQDVLVAWGDDIFTACRDLVGRPNRSVARLLGGWAPKRAPQRLAAVWPARCWMPRSGAAFGSPAWRTLAEDPPVVSWGWNEGATAVDLVQCSGLRQRIQGFLEQVPGIGR